MVYISACHSKGQQFESRSGQFCGFYSLSLKNNCVLKVINEKIHPYVMATLKKIYNSLNIECKKKLGPSLVCHKAIPYLFTIKK